MLSREEILDILKEFLAEQLDVESMIVVEEASFQDDLDADSLDLVELIMELEDRFGITIDDKDAQGMHAVGDALDYLVEHQPPEGYKYKKKGEDGTAGVREPASPSPTSGADGAAADEATVDSAA